ncbi:MAG TPA: DUF3592 domain-containing protein [Caulobacteraceae bacterium]|jgi:hypothetical protein
MAKLLGILILLVGVGLMWRAWASQKQAKAAAGWPRVAGVVTASRVDTDRKSGGNGQSEIRYMTNVSYTYDVAGAQHIGRRIAFADPGYVTEKAAQAVLAPYGVGAPVSVLVDPANPDNAVLSAKSRANLFLPWLFIAIGGVIAMVMPA